MYTKSATYLTAPPAVVSLQRAHKKYWGYKNPLFAILYEDQTNVQECLHMVKWGVQLVASEPPRAPGYYSYSKGTLQAFSLLHMSLITTGISTAICRQQAWNYT